MSDHHGGNAYFGPAAAGFVPGGAHVAVYLVPVFEGRLVVFDVAAREARGRWLPWDVLGWGANPYEAASALADEWCDVPVIDLRLVDIMSFPFEGSGWELAIIFRAELPEPARGDDARTPYIYPAGQFDALGNFDPVDLERWVAAFPAPAPVSKREPSQHPKLLF
jgi:hypothetical protein